jgi:hypothetical protein
MGNSRCTAVLLSLLSLFFSLGNVERNSLTMKSNSVRRRTFPVFTVREFTATS